LAASATLIAKMERIGNYELDRRGMTKHYRDLAKHYQEYVDATPAVGIVEIPYSDFQAAEIIHNDRVRTN